MTGDRKATPDERLDACAMRIRRAREDLQLAIEELPGYRGLTPDQRQRSAGYVALIKELQRTIDSAVGREDFERNGS